MNNESRNLILAVVLSALVFFGWGWVQHRYFPTPATTAAATNIPGPQLANPPATVIAGGKEMIVPNPGAQPTVPGAAAPAAVRDRAAVLTETPRVAIRTPVATGSVNLVGARIDDLTLLKYRETIAANSANIRLLSPSGAAGAAFAAFGFTGAGAPPADAKWTASGATLAPGQPVTLSYAGASGVEYQLGLTIADDYLIRVEHRIVNRGTAPATARPWSLVTRTGAGTDVSSFTAYFGPTAIVDGDIEHVSWDFISGKDRDSIWYTLGFSKRPELVNRFTRGWLGFSEKYWLTALASDQKVAVDTSFRHGAGDRYQADLSAPALTAAPGATATRTGYVFAGAKEVDTLQRIERKFGIAQFDNAIDWGWFRIIAKPIFSVLDYLFKLTGNFGLAIIGLVLILKTLLFPIAAKQYSSMAKMRVLGPKLKELQARHKDDKAKLQTEMMEFYKREKVNPVGGCLPTLVQIPIFFALYKTLLVTIEMRHQPFIGWIRDLSSPDPLSPVNLFGLLPWNGHIGSISLAIGILPIILGVTMYIQQKQNPPSPDPAQAQIFAFMPWVFMFIMAPFAAGLQLYWATNNTLTILQQLWFKRNEPKAGKTIVTVAAK